MIHHEQMAALVRSDNLNHLFSDVTANINDQRSAFGCEK